MGHNIFFIETFYDFISKMVEVYNDEKSTLEEKLKLTSSKYIDMILTEKADSKKRLDL